MIYGTLEGANLDMYKVGNEYDTDTHLMLNVIRQILPDKLSKISHLVPCFFSMSHNEEFIFERAGDHTIYAFGLSGRGFKHMGYHGKRLYYLTIGNQQEADKYKVKPGHQIGVNIKQYTYPKL